eukprot:7835573-Ditylum_brightwellii.AAC.1
MRNPMTTRLFKILVPRILLGNQMDDDDDEQDFALVPRQTNRACSTGFVVKSVSLDDKSANLTQSSNSSGSHLSRNCLTGGLGHS